MRSCERSSVSSSAGGICSNGSPRRRRRSGHVSTSTASIDGWAEASSSRHRGRDRRGTVGAGAWPIAAPFVVLWIASPADRAMDQPLAARGRSPRDLRSRRPRAAAGRAAHMALLRDIRHGDGPHAAAGQLPGGPETRPRPSDVARPISASISCLPSPPATSAGSERARPSTARGHARDDGPPAALPRPFLQLVRHARSASAGSEIRLVGRQRQSGGPLIALANACREWVQEPMADRLSSEGVMDAMELTRAALRELPSEVRTNTTACIHLEHALDQLAVALLPRRSRVTL